MKSSDNVVKAALSDLQNITERQLGVLLEHLTSMFEVSSDAGADALTSVFESEWSNDRARARRASASVVIVAQNIRAQESLSAFLKRAKRLLGKEPNEALQRSIESIAARIRDVEAEIDRNEIIATTRSGVGPSFNAIGATVELRAVFGAQLDGFNHALTPNVKVVGLEPIASIRIDLDSGDPDRLVFQIGTADLDHLISSLKEIRQKMTDLASFARVES